MGELCRTAINSNGAIERLSVDGNRLYVWAWDAINGEMHQLCITGICTLVEARTGRIIKGVDVARWLVESSTDDADRKEKHNASD